MNNLFYAKITADSRVDFSNKKALQEYLATIVGKTVSVRIERTTGVRTTPQNNALHKYCEILAHTLNEGGFPFKFQLGDKFIELDWDTELIKNNIWRPIQIALTGKKSTTTLNKASDIDKVYSHLNRFFSNPPFCFHVPFPEKEKIEESDLQKLHEGLEIPEGKPSF